MVVMKRRGEGVDQRGDALMVIKRVEPLSCAKITGLLYAILGVVFGAIFSLTSLATGIASNSAGAGGFGAIMGMGAILAFPILYGGMGFVTALIGAWLYNVLAELVGGIELDVQ
jgi:hypothetical protein